ncbi:MAG: PilZ domain-containing protein [Aestuariibacter sp.]
MTQQFEDYSEIIEQLKSYVNEPDFAQTLLDVAKDLPKPKVFLLKMELKRIARPCKKIIDLREKVESTCSPVEYEGLTHYLDDLAQEVFDKQFRIFGRYTVGVYEAVYPTNINGDFVRDSDPQEEKKRRLQEARKARQVADSGEINYTVPLFQFADAEHRNEERMNFISPVELEAPDKTMLKATTIDISVNGIQVKTLQEHEFKFDDRFFVYFRGLEKEFSLDRKKGISYRVVKYEKTKEDHRIAFQRDVTAPDDKFDGFMRNFIKGNKARYKVNIDNTLHAIKSKTYEQYYVPYFTSLPIYIEKVSKEYRPTYILNNDNNRDAVYYWTDEDNHIVLGQVLNDRRINELLENPIRETYLFCFNHVRDGKVYFYSATEEELERSRVAKNPFFGFGSRKASWRVFKLQIEPVNAQEECFRPLSVPDDVSEDIRKINTPPSSTLMAKIQNISYVLLMTNVADALSTLAYQRRSVGQEHLTALQDFAHPKIDKHLPIAMHRFKYQNLRNEVRYQLRTKVVIRQQKLLYEGITEDVSTGGLSIELSKKFMGEKNTVVGISFPDLQENTTEFQLKNLPYEIRNVSSDRIVIKLKTFTPSNHQGPHVGSVFFDGLIKSNRNSLRMENEGDDDSSSGIGEALRNIYCSNVLNIAFFMSKEGSRFYPNAMTEPNSHHRLKNLFAYGVYKPGEEMNSFPLFAADGRFKTFIEDNLKRLKAESAPVMRELFIRYKPDEKNPEEAIKCKFSEQFRNDHDRRSFIVEAIGDGRFYAVKLIMSRTGRPDQEILRTELGYVSVYAAHKAKAIEEELWKIAGAGDIIDITDEAVRRYGFTEQHVMQNQEGDKQIYLNPAPEE